MSGTTPAVAATPAVRTTAGDRPRPGRSAIVVSLVFTLASALGVNPYVYGVLDTRMTAPFVKAFANPLLYGGDYLIAQRQYYYTWLWNALGLLVRAGARIEIVYFATYLVVLFATFLGFYLIAMALFRSRAVAVIALSLLLLSQASLGGVDTIEQDLTTRGAALPFLLFAILAFLKGRELLAFALVAPAYLIHPMTGHYVLGLLIVGMFVRWRRAAFGRIALPLLVFLLLASPILVWRFTNPPPGLHWFSVDPRWLQALRDRSSFHMFPFSWGWPALLHAAAAVFLFVVGWRHRDRGAGAPDQVVPAFVGAILVACAAGVVFAEWWPLAINLTLQPIRSFEFLDLIVMLYMADFLYRRAAEERWWSGLLILVPMALWICCSVWSYYEEPAYFRPALEIGLIAVVYGLAHAFRGGRSEGRAFITVVSVLACVVGFTCFAYDRAQDEHPTVSIWNAQDREYLDVARWAHTHTDVDARFVVPPREPDAFRVESERTIYGDWVDGGLGNDDPSFSLEWARRMRRLGPYDFCGLRAADIIAVAREMDLAHHRVFLMWPCATGFDFPVRYRNMSYAVYEVVD